LKQLAKHAVKYTEIASNRTTFPKAKIRCLH
jgi:hypothetical protein